MAQTIDQKISTPQPEEKDKATKIISPLEEIAGAAKSIANIGIAAAAPLVADQYMGGYDAAATSAAFYLGEKDKSSRYARIASIAGASFAAFAKYTLGPISDLNVYARAALIPLWQAAANLYYIASDHILRKNSLSGITENFKQNYRKMTKKVILWLSIPTYLTTFLPGPWQIPSIAIQSYIFKKYIAGDGKETAKEKDKTPYSVVAANAIRRLGNGISGLYRSIYDFGSTLFRGSHKRADKTPAAQPA